MAKPLCKADGVPACVFIIQKVSKYQTNGPGEYKTLHLISIFHVFVMICLVVGALNTKKGCEGRQKSSGLPFKKGGSRCG